MLLAERLRDLGAKVTLLLGPAEPRILNTKIKLIRFRFFDELMHLIKNELALKKYDLVIHSAAVSDYRPRKVFRQKMQSDIKEWKLTLVPTAKIIDLIKKTDSSLFVVGFKLGPKIAKEILITKARGLMHRANLNLVVANTINKNKYLAYIVDNCNRTYGPAYNKKDMAEELISLIGG